MHQAQDHAFTRCRYICHLSANTELCDAFNEDPYVATIRSLKIHLVTITSVIYMFMTKHLNLRSEHAFQWMLCSHVKMGDLVQKILNSQNPDRMPLHLRGTWHEIKCCIMEELLEAKVMYIMVMPHQ